MRKLAILSVILFLSVYMQAQQGKTFYDCYAVTVDNDTIYGKTNMSGSSYSSVFKMWKSKKDKKEVYPWSVKQFIVNGKTFDSVRLKNCKTCNRHLFMQRTISGQHMVLYRIKSNRKRSKPVEDNSSEHSADCRTNYYIRLVNDDVTVLAYSESCDEDVKEIEPAFSPEYIAKFFEEVPELKTKIVKKEVELSDIESLVQEFNEKYEQKDK